MFDTEFRPPSRSADPELWAVHDALRSADPAGDRSGYVIREAFDQAYDGQRTGRWDYTQLSKTEKTHIGTLVQIWMQREFRFEDGIDLDFRIVDVDVDCKWSRNLYEWEIPEEMYVRGPKVAMLVWGNDYTSRWALGLLRIDEAVLKPRGGQRDRKRKLNERGRDQILWVFRDVDLVSNTLLHVSSDVRRQIVEPTSGQVAVSNLFRLLPGVLVNRATVATAAQQIDTAKRVRDARAELRPHGIVIFGHYRPHPELATGLGLPAPTLGRFVSARLAPFQDGDAQASVEIQGNLWRLAEAGDPQAAAPMLPSQGR